ncbi:response regulator [Brasilonema sp. UFV-L1]|uniref:response regulator n=1 Tax=Brasilonema sp. UFV-L1 TaxID=2234130 RepID=UPI00145C990F|nr:response regulator [Brasilonema sp. UFV-L1]NMG07517.1 two-component system response regulator [Brasilonema sp. UFV-L1]
MTTLPIGRYRFFQTLQPLSLLGKMTSKPLTGCWQVFSPSVSWSIYLDEGKLIYACYTDKMFDLIDRHLERLSEQFPTINRGISKQLQTVFNAGLDNQEILNPDYLAICWLVNQKYITPAQAGVLIEQLAIEVLEPFLKIKEGSYEFTSESFINDMPKFCHLDLCLIVEKCQYYSQNQGNTKSRSKRQRFYSFASKIWQPQKKTEQKFTNTNSAQTTEVKNNDGKQQQNYQKSSEVKVYKIVCIDDSPVIINSISNFLDDKMFSVIAINDSLKALMQIIRVKPDLILLDIEMPSLDGYELCSLLRKHSYFQNTPVIMVTGRTGIIDRAKAKMVRATGYLTKPFTQVDLLKVVFHHIEGL